MVYLQSMINFGGGIATPLEAITLFSIRTSVSHLGDPAISLHFTSSWEDRVKQNKQATSNELIE